MDSRAEVNPRVAPTPAKRRSRADLVALAWRLASLVLKRPGLGIEAICGALGVTRPDLKVPLRLAQASQLVQTRGRAGATRYFATPTMEARSQAVAIGSMWRATPAPRASRKRRTTPGARSPVSGWGAVAVSIRKYGNGHGVGQQHERQFDEERDGDR
jgi:hypothetical protein